MRRTTTHLLMGTSKAIVPNEVNIQQYSQQYNL